MAMDIFFSKGSIFLKEFSEAYLYMKCNLLYVPIPNDLLIKHQVIC